MKKMLVLALVNIVRAGKLLPLLLLLTVSAAARGGLIGHYTFDDPSNIGADSSGNGNDANGLNNVTYVSDSVSGGAVSFTQSDSSYLSWAGTANPIAKVLAGDFSFSLWLKTTEIFGSDTDQGFEGASIVYADVPGGSNDSIPMALNGSKLGFDTGYPDDNTIHSASAINTGNYVFVAVTWVQSTGLKSIYVNGVLEAQTNHSAGADLSGRDQLALGGNLTDSRYFSGEIDDFQVYSEALTLSQVAYLYHHAGRVIPMPPPLNLKIALKISAQGTNNVVGAVSTTASPMLLKLTTKDLLNALAFDEHVEGKWPSISFPKNSTLALAGNSIVVLNGTNILLNVSDIMRFNTGESKVVSGKQNIGTGLAYPKAQKLLMAGIIFDDTFINGGKNLKFYLNGVLSQTTTDTTPVNGVYTETQTVNMTAAAGDGSSLDAPFICTGSVSGTGKCPLSL
jgi:hypothetical protein